jgi:hypothetical protein
LKNEVIQNRRNHNNNNTYLKYSFLAGAKQAGAIRISDAFDLIIIIKYLGKSLADFARSSVSYNMLSVNY